ncbi:MAG TPA: sulfite exporter TauE/SafE family protein [Bacteroidia bacterium]
MEFVFVAISLGFLGSFHCVGMCGPIALALPVHNLSLTKKVFSVLTYNLGRILTYSTFGILFGIIGQSFDFFGWQQSISIFLGSVILIGLFIPKTLTGKSKIAAYIYSGLNKLKARIGDQFRRNGIRSFFSIGLLNGLLPCGLVYIAVAGAVATGDIVKGAVFMAVFGLGTIPFMLIITFTSHLITIKSRNMIRKVIPVMVGVMAVLLILRGLNLNIAYISPKLETTATSTHCDQKMSCCHKK